MALTRITKGVIKPNENYDTHDINSTGIITATGGNITGNLTVGGVLTYEDVSSIDAVGIITANQGIHVGAGLSAVGVGTFSGADIDDFISVGSNIHLGSAGVVTATSYRGDGSQLTGIVAGLSTISGVVNVSNDIKIGAGVTITPAGAGFYAGVVTATTFSGSGASLTSIPAANLTGTLPAISGANLTSVNADTVDGIQAASFARSDATDTLTGEITLSNNLIKFSGTSNDRTVMHFIKSGEIKWRLLQNSYQAGGGDNLNFDRVNGTGIFMVDGYRVLTTSDINAQASGAVHSGISTFQDLDVDGHTNLDNVSIAGITTTNQISVGTGATISSDGNITAGIVTFSGGTTIFGGGTYAVKIKNEGGTDLWSFTGGGNFEPAFNNFFSIGDTTKQVNNIYTKNLYVGDDIIHNGDTNTKIRFPAADTVSIETAGSERLRAENSGVVITGVTTFSASAHVSNASGSVFFGAGNATSYGNQGGIGRAGGSNYHIGSSAVGDLCIAAEGSKRILFGTKTGTGIGGITKRMSIASSGTVTIDGNLDAVGGIDATANSTFAGDLDVDGHTNLDNVSIAGVTTSSNKFQVNGLGIGIQPIDHHHIHIESANPRILIRSTGTNAAKILFGDNSSNDPGVIEYAHSENSMRFNTGNLERLRIASNGRVQIASGGDLYVVGSSYNSTLNGNILSFDRAGYSYIDQTHNSGSLNFRVTASNTIALRLDNAAQALFPQGVILLGTQNTSSGHINAYENMSFNIDTDNDDTNRYFSFHKNGMSASGTVLLRINEDGNIIHNSTEALQIAKGTTGERPSSPVVGMVRFNTSTDTLENYTSSGWQDVNITIPTIDSISGEIYAGLPSNITLNMTNATATISIVFKEGGTTHATLTNVSVSGGAATVSVPSAVYGQSAGDTILINIINNDSISSPQTSKTVQSVPTGGSVTTSGDYRIHTFTSSGTLTAPSGWSSSYDYLVVAGGGSGGNNKVGSFENGGGGGAGGMLTGSSTLSAGSYSIGIGNGGAIPGGDGQTKGGNTTAFGLTAIGGGGGRTRDTGLTNCNGGSGGGTTNWDDYNSPGSGTSGQGNSGGTAGQTATSDGGSGGGGGKGSTGGTGSGGNGGSGGSGGSSSITGSSVTYAGGGGGGGGNGGSGSGGGGSGGSSGSVNGGSGSTNKGGGGGGNYASAGNAGNGGSGVVILRYKKT